VISCNYDDSLSPYVVTEMEGLQGDAVPNSWTAEDIEAAFLAQAPQPASTSAPSLPLKPKDEPSKEEGAQLFQKHFIFLEYHFLQICIKGTFPFSSG